MVDSAVQIVEVGARDGLQNESVVVPTECKIRLINALIDAGVRRLEVASFVNPRRVPQMADAEAVVAGLPDRSDISYVGLCLNVRGALRALETRAGNRRGVDEIGCVVVASNTFGERNQGQNSEESLTEAGSIIRLAAEHGVTAQVAISVAFGCPYDGAVSASYVADLAARVAEYGPVEIALADTIGVAVPAQVRQIFRQVRAAVPASIRLRAHFHDTHNTGIANTWTAFEEGVRVFDSSIGGLGGCPFAPGALGNVATEDLVYLMQMSGVATRLDLNRLGEASDWLAQIIGRPLRPSRRVTYLV